MNLTFLNIIAGLTEKISSLDRKMAFFYLFFHHTKKIKKNNEE